jgi:hypothetical protein
MTDDFPENGEKIDLASRKVYPVGWGLVYRVVCASADMSDDEISDIVTRNDPPGTSLNEWNVTSDESAADHPNWPEVSGGTTARAPCPDCDDRVHVLMNC